MTPSATALARLERNNRRRPSTRFVRGHREPCCSSDAVARTLATPYIMPPAPPDWSPAQPRAGLL
eukprot:2212976-Lingulodinium_polyedra.AAC.1